MATPWYSLLIPVDRAAARSSANFGISGNWLCLMPSDLANGMMKLAMLLCRCANCWAMVGAANVFPMYGVMPSANSNILFLGMYFCMNASGFFIASSHISLSLSIWLFRRRNDRPTCCAIPFASTTCLDLSAASPKIFPFDNRFQWDRTSICSPVIGWIPFISENVRVAMSGSVKTSPRNPTTSFPMSTSFPPRKSGSRMFCQVPGEITSMKSFIRTCSFPASALPMRSSGEKSRPSIKSLSTPATACWGRPRISSIFQNRLSLSRSSSICCFAASAMRVSSVVELNGSVACPTRRFIFDMAGRLADIEGSGISMILISEQ